MNLNYKKVNHQQLKLFDLFLMLKQVEGFLAEKNMTFCYEYLEQCISTIYSNLSNMENQRWMRLLFCFGWYFECSLCLSEYFGFLTFFFWDIHILFYSSRFRECPSECREAVATLMHAAARFADLPEVRELRTVFTERFGSSLESFVSKEVRIHNHRSRTLYA